MNGFSFFRKSRYAGETRSIFYFWNEYQDTAYEGMYNKKAIWYILFCPRGSRAGSEYKSRLALSAGIWGLLL